MEQQHEHIFVKRLDLEQLYGQFFGQQFLMERQYRDGQHSGHDRG